MDLESTNICLAYAFRISGLPYIFSTINLPSNWEDSTNVINVESEYYTWKPTIVGDLQIGESKIQPWLGVASPASFKTAIAIDSDIKSLMNRDIYRSGKNVCQLTGNATPSYAFLGVNSTTGFDTSGDIYANTETIYYDSVETTRFADLTRARYGSYAQHHFGTLSEEDSYSSGIYLSDFPLTLNDRIITVWIIQGQQRNDGTFAPDEDTLEACDVIYTGIVKNVSYGNNLKTIDITCTDLCSLLEKEVGATQLKAWIPDNDSRVNIDGFSELLQMELRIGGAIENYQKILTNGYRSIQEVIDEINTDLASYSTALFGVYRFALTKESGDKYKIIITCSDTSSTRDHPIKLFTGNKSFIKELGFTETQTIEADGTYFWEFIADTARPLFRVEKNHRSSMLVVPQDNNWSFAFASPVLMMDQYNADLEHDAVTLANYVRVGDEIFEFDDYDVETYDGVTYNRLYITERGCFGSLPEEPATLLTVEDDPKEAIRGIAINNLEWPRLIAYLLVAGNQTDEGYDEAGWLNMCAAIPRGLIDEAAFTALAKSPEGATKHKVYIDKPTAIKDIIDSILVLHQAYLVCENGKITIKTVPTKLETDKNEEIDDNVNFTEDDILSIDNLGIDVSDDFIVNVIRAIDINYNWCTEEGTQTKTIADGLSCGTFGRKEAAEISFKTLQNYIRPDELLSNYVGEIFGKWSSPFFILNVTINSNRALLLHIGQSVSVNHSIINSFLEVNGIDGRIFGIKKTLKGDGARTSLMIVSSAKDGTRNSLWAPCAKVETISSKPPEINIYTNRYCGTTDTYDNAYFFTNCICRCFNPGEEENFFTFRINNDGVTSSNVTAYSITVIDGSISNVDPNVAVIEYVDFNYDYASSGVYVPLEAQKNYVHLATSTKPYLEDAESDDYPPFHYL